MSDLYRGQFIISFPLLIVFSIIYFNTHDLVATTVIVAGVVAIPTIGVALGGFSEVVKPAIVGVAIATAVAAAMAIGTPVAVGWLAGLTTGISILVAMVATMAVIIELVVDKWIIIVLMFIQATILGACMYGVSKII